MVKRHLNSLSCYWKKQKYFFQIFCSPFGQRLSLKLEILEKIIVPMLAGTHVLAFHSSMCRLYRVSQKKVWLAVSAISYTSWHLLWQIIPFLKSAEPEVFKNGIICFWSLQIVRVIKQQSPSWLIKNFLVFKIFTFILYK